MASKNTPSEQFKCRHSTGKPLETGARDYICDTCELPWHEKHLTRQGHRPALPPSQTKKWECPRCRNLCCCQINCAMLGSSGHRCCHLRRKQEKERQQRATRAAKARGSGAAAAGGKSRGGRQGVKASKAGVADGGNRWATAASIRRTQRRVGKRDLPVDSERVAAAVAVAAEAAGLETDGANHLQVPNKRVCVRPSPAQPTSRAYDSLRPANISTPAPVPVPGQSPSNMFSSLSHSGLSNAPQQPTPSTTPSAKMPLPPPSMSGVSRDAATRSTSLLPSAACSPSGFLPDEYLPPHPSNFGPTRADASRGAAVNVSRRSALPAPLRATAHHRPAHFRTSSSVRLESPVIDARSLGLPTRPYGRPSAISVPSCHSLGACHSAAWAVHEDLALATPVDPVVGFSALERALSCPAATGVADIASAAPAPLPMYESSDAPLPSHGIAGVRHEDAMFSSALDSEFAFDGLDSFFDEIGFGDLVDEASAIPSALPSAHHAAHPSSYTPSASSAPSAPSAIHATAFKKNDFGPLTPTLGISEPLLPCVAPERVDVPHMSTRTASSSESPTSSARPSSPARTAFGSSPSSGKVAAKVFSFETSANAKRHASESSSCTDTASESDTNSLGGLSDGDRRDSSCEAVRSSKWLSTAYNGMRPGVSSPDEAAERASAAADVYSSFMLPEFSVC